MERWSRERPLERGTIERAAVRREHVLDRQLEQRAQPFGDALTRHSGAEPPLVVLEALAEVDEGVPEITAPWLSTQSTVSFGLCPGSTSAPNGNRSPGEYVRASPFPSRSSQTTSGCLAGLLGGDAVRLHEVFRGIGQRVKTGAPIRSTRPSASRSCHGQVSTIAVSRSAASASISPGTPSGSNSGALVVRDRVGRDVRVPGLTRLPVG